MPLTAVREPLSPWSLVQGIEFKLTRLIVRVNSPG